MRALLRALALAASLTACATAPDPVGTPSSTVEQPTVTAEQPTTTVIPGPTTTTLIPTPTVTAQPPTTVVVPPPVTVTPSPTTTTVVPAPPTGRVYPWHDTTSTTFWVGERFNDNLADGSQVCSTYDSQWAYHWSGGVNNGNAPVGTDCEGSIIGGCDGVPGKNNACATEVRRANNDYFPTSPKVTPKENPFYLDLPYDDMNDPIGFRDRCKNIPWAMDDPSHCKDAKNSYMKNRWVRIIGPNGKTCYGQNEDAGPSHDDAYHDVAYVFGDKNTPPGQGQFNDAGMDVSPALNGCLGFKELDGENDRIRWQFVDAVDVPAGPWTRIVTTSGFTS